jgi:hypothetical protein
VSSESTISRLIRWVKEEGAKCGLHPLIHNLASTCFGTKYSLQLGSFAQSFLRLALLKWLGRGFHYKLLGNLTFAHLENVD